MKKLFIWMAIVLGGLAVVFIAVSGYFFLRLMYLGDYPSGGVLSDNQSRFDVSFYDIHLTVDPDEQTIGGYTTLKILALSDSLDMIELDLLNHLSVTSVTDDQARLYDFQRDDHKLRIHFPPVKKNSLISLSIHYNGKPLKAFYPPWKGGFNWSEDMSGNPWIGLSCQGEGAKVWIPCKDHPSDEPDSAGIHITVSDNLFCASNGVLDSIVKNKEGAATYHWMTRYPINNYCINISIGAYTLLTRNYISLSGDTMPVIYYVLPQNLPKADTLIDMAVDMLYIYRKYFGEYPFILEKFGLADNDYLGMEHQTLNAYGNHYTFDHIQGHRFDQLMLHEMGHEWWGNKITAKDWADFWIHESFCTYGESLYHLEKTGEAGYHEYIRRIRNQVNHRRPIISPANATTTDAYHSDIYYKGACLLHSLRYIMGDSVFFHFLKSFNDSPLLTYRHLVSTEDIFNLAHQISKTDLKPYMAFFLNTTDVIEINVDSTDINCFNISLTNTDFSLPMDIRTDKTIQRYSLSKEPLRINSSIPPVIDERNWYLKKIVYSVSPPL